MTNNLCKAYMNIKNISLLISLLILSCMANSENLLGSCQEHYLSKQWEKSKLSCELELNKNNPNQNSLSLLSKLANIYARLDNSDKELFYMEAVKNHSEFSNNLLEQYYWHRRMGQLAFYKTNYDAAGEFFENTFEFAAALNNKELQSKSFND